MLTETIATGIKEVTLYMPTQDKLLEIRGNSAQYPRIKNIPYQQSYEAICTIVLRSYVYQGFRPDTDTVKTIASLLLEEIIADQENFGLSTLTIEEINYILRRDALTEKQYRGISVCSLFCALVRYVKGEGHELEKKLKAIKDGKSAAATAMIAAQAVEFAKSHKA